MGDVLRGAGRAVEVVLVRLRGIVAIVRVSGAKVLTSRKGLR